VLTLIEDYGTLLLFLIVLAEQIGLPVPAIPAMMLAGALIADGKGPWETLLPAMLAASVLGDSVCFAIGRRYGWRVMKLLCSVALSPDSCVRQTSLHFERWGGWTLVVGKFIPAVGTIAPPLSGVLGMRWTRFLVLSFLGALLWVGLAVGAGAIFHEQINVALAAIEQFGARAAAVVFALFAVYVAFKWWERRRFYKMLRMARITVDELHGLFERNADPLVVDLRPHRDREREGAIPGARAIDLSEVTIHLASLPKDREIVFFCSCPNEASAAAAAKLLVDLGYTRVRPLEGGFPAWAAAGYKIILGKVQTT
jgi:membrane protein DedA with SNARE-associated domain/rhodanese-related sulfurtransferase